MEDNDKDFSPVKGILGLFTFSTIIPLGVHTSYAYMTKILWVWPLIHFVIGILAAILGFISLEIFNFNVLLTSAIVYGFLLIISGYNHVDGLMDMADGIMVHGDSKRKIEVMKDHMVGAGGICTFFIIASITVFSLSNVLSYNFLAAIIIAEMLSKTSLLTTCLTSIGPEDGIGMHFINSLNKTNYLISLFFVTAIALLIGGYIAIFGVFGAIISGGLISIIARNNFEIANGDVLGASNELGRLFAIIFMLIALAI